MNIGETVYYVVEEWENDVWVRVNKQKTLDQSQEWAYHYSLQNSVYVRVLQVKTDITQLNEYDFSEKL